MTRRAKPVEREVREAGIGRELPRAERLLRILERDGSECVWCRRALGSGHRDLSLEHVVPRLKGGPAWPENEVCSCRSCNRVRGHAAPALWLDECEARGLSPRREVVVAICCAYATRSPSVADSAGHVRISTGSCAGSA